MRVALVAGPSRAGRCGVGDYTACLAKALNARGVESAVVSSGNWSLAGVCQTSSELRKSAFDLVHVQYPTVGFGTKLGPQGLALLRSCVITVHEASRAHILRKLSLLPFTVRTKHMVFTSHFERDFALKWVPWVSQFSSVIPIGSNVRTSSNDGIRDLNEIVHFGLIMPGKGLEAVLGLAELIKEGGFKLRIRIIGNTPAKHEAYFEELRSKADRLPIVWDCGLPEKQISEKLACASIAYLPYPDGASERRATLKAALANGVVVITKRGPQTPRALEGVLRFCDDPEEALIAIKALIGSPEERASLMRKGRQYAQQYSWDYIADLHGKLYHQLLSSYSQHAAETETAHVENRFV